MDTHFEKACGVTPHISAKSLWLGIAGGDSSKNDFILKSIINPYLMRVNREFIHSPPRPTYNQPMVNAFIDNLLREKEDRELSWAAIGELAGVSAQAAHKWSKGGNIDDGQLNKLAAAWGMSPLELKYGTSTTSRPPTITDEDWGALSTKRRDLIERLAQPETPDSVVDLLDAVMGATEQKPPTRPTSAVSAGPPSAKQKAKKPRVVERKK